ncbi:Peptidase family M48 [Dendrosporobacter quercicolus]|uniref:Peptidase family M48 n=1 Tax=Dendrosporobacter quercicolus TaxID=146817 RepID=A0A1G9Q3S9_9FIRM|nr:M48 family metallopeptidase [Dendrosporobacter quercicolus]SDM05660.1 Peptidase family M48 [Dendrosporobacter quercicolus]
MLLRRVTGLLLLLLTTSAFFMPAASAGLISTKDEISIGRSVGKQLEEKYGVVDDPALQERVTRIGMNMVAVSDRSNLPYSFKVLNSKEINAMAAPGGYIYIFQGLVDYMQSDDELAGVIGHEIGHVVKRHTVRQMEKSLGLSLLFGVVFGDRGVMLQNLAYNAIMAGHSRSDEREADYLGFTHSFKAGYNPYSMLLGLYKLSELDQKYHYDLFSDHPEGKARIALVQKQLREAGIEPLVVLDEDGKTARVVDGEWQLPPIYATLNGYKPLLRAYFVAGNLYRLRELSDYSSDKYILDTDGTNFTVYYDDRKIITVTPEDAAAQSMSVQELANLHIDTLRNWQPKQLLDQNKIKK